MIREIVKDTFFLSQKSEPATRQDQPVIQDLLDTVRANADRCVGMAANMIGERKTILVAQAGKDYLVMVNPKIVDHSRQCYETEEGCVADGTASGQTVQRDRGGISGSKIQTEKADVPRF